MIDLPWWIWLGIAWLATVLLIVCLNHRYSKRMGDLMRQWEDDEHKGGV